MIVIVKKYDKKTSARPRFWIQNFVILSRLCSHNLCTFCLFCLLREFCVLPIAPPATRIFFAFHARSNFALFLRIFEAIPGTLKRPSSHAGECATALYVIIYYFAKIFTAWFGTDLLIVVERSKDLTHLKFLLSLVAKNSDICECIKRE